MSVALSNRLEFAPRSTDQTTGETRARRAALSARSSGRRRKIDPTTCERDYTADELEWILAIQQYKVRSGRMFPTWSEALEVLRALGYAKVGTEAAR